MIKYNSGAEPLMFWMQDKSADKDTEYCTKVNDYINNPNAAAAAAAAATSGSQIVPGASETATGGDGDALSSLLASLNVMGLPPAPSRGGARPAPLTAEAFRSIMAGASTPAPVPPAAATPAPISAPALTALQSEAEPPLELQEVLSADAVLASGLLDDAEVCRRLMALLPEGQNTRADLETALRSPQLADSMRALSQALQSDNYNAVMTNFGLDPSRGMSALMQGQAVEAFLQAIASQATATTPNNNTTNTNTSDQNNNNTNSNMDAE